MENIKQLLQDFNNDLIIDIPQIGVFRNEKFRREVVRKVWYANLSDEEFDSKKYKYLRCGEIVGCFVNVLKKHGYKARGIFLWTTYLTNMCDIYFDYKYIDAVINKQYDVIKKYEDMIIFKIGKTKDTHAIIELENKYIIDPMVGLIYNGSLEMLKKSNNIYESWKFMDQYKFFKNSIHWGTGFNLTFVTKIFWNNVISHFYKEF